MEKKSSYKSKILIYVALHFELFLFSLGNVCSKKASQCSFLSPDFILLYSIIIINLMLYAFFWQQIIKRLSLTTAFANKAITVVWGIVWGAVFFHENISIGKMIGALLVIIGVVLYAKFGDENGV